MTGEFGSLLRGAKLAQYTDALVAAGWDDVEYIRSMDAAQVDEM